MVILGLGTNIDDRLWHLRQTLQEIKRIPGLKVQQVSPVYRSDALLPPDAPQSWNKPYFNACVRCETTLTPQTLLTKTKEIEKKLGRKEGADWCPRIIDIDLLAWDDLVLKNDSLQIPHEHLHSRPFAIFPLRDVAPFWVYPVKSSFQGKTAYEIAHQWGAHAPLNTQPIAQRIDTPELVGIINLTPDSFSNEGQICDPQLLVSAGAAIVDLGAEATGPEAHAISPEEEFSRLLPVLNKIFTTNFTDIIPKISIDTYHVETAKQVLQFPIHWINDVTGLDNSKMRELLAGHACDVVFMHHLGIPVRHSQWLPFTEDPVNYLFDWGQKRIEEAVGAGIDQRRLIFDIGVGFGKNAPQSAKIIRHIEQFKKLGVRLLVGHSRKSFLKDYTHLIPAERDIETLAVSNFLAQQAVDYLRVHNVEYHARFLKVATSFKAETV